MAPISKMAPVPTIAPCPKKQPAPKQLRTCLYPNMPDVGEGWGVQTCLVQARLKMPTLTSCSSSATLPRLVRVGGCS